MSPKFPHNFFFGAATASHQVEGYGNNDWTEWEKANAERLAKEAKEHPPVGGWPDYILHSYPSPLDPQNYISGKACDSYYRFKEDFDIAKQLGHNAHRLSLSWSKIEPREGVFDQKEIEHYKEKIQALRERGMEPFVTLYHWPVPLWFRDKGGWEAADAIEQFQTYVARVAESLNHHITYWLVINEPEVYVFNGYFRGHWPPMMKSIRRTMRVFLKLARAHRAAFRTIKQYNPNARVGSAKNNNHFKSLGGPINAALKFFADRLWNDSWFWFIKNQYDFIGLNYYFHSSIDWGFNKNPNKVISDVGWEIDPRGLYDVLRDLKKYNKPIFITENGVADIRDAYRADFIEQHLVWAQKAIEDGVPLLGYFYWTLLDNFEWSKGFWPRFGLVEIDYKTLERKIRPSAWKFKEIIDNAKK